MFKGRFPVFLAIFFGVITTTLAQQAQTTSQNQNVPDSQPQLKQRSDIPDNTASDDSQQDPLKRQLSDKQRFKQQKELKQELKGPYRKWVDEDVRWIITDQELKAFKSLSNDEERDAFIEQFWQRRNPNPDSPENEYREEHYRRIEYANEHFAAGKPGWKTDRGMIYIKYGKPDSIDSHPSGGTYDRPIEEGGGTTSTFPFETWRYRYIEGIGNEVILEFVDPSMSGEYHMTIDPSEKDALLHVPGAGLTFDEQMYGRDKAERFNRAGASIGSPLGNTSRTNPFDKVQLLADIYKPPEVKYK